MGILEGGDAVLSVLRYVERSPVRSGPAMRAEGWRWGSAAAREGGPTESEVPLVEPPGARPGDWLEAVNRPRMQGELDALVGCVRRGCPFGPEAWVQRMAAEWNLQCTLRHRRRPRKTPQNGS